MIPPLLGAAAGVAVLHLLAARFLAVGGAEPGADRPRVGRPIERPGPSRVPLGWDRRRFLVAGGTATAVAVTAGGLARSIEGRRVGRHPERDPHRAASAERPPGGDPGRGRREPGHAVHHPHR